MENVQKYRQLLQNNGVMFSIAGVISQDLLTIFIQSLKDKIDLLLKINPKAHNIFNIFIEQAQNIINYSKIKDININDIINSNSIMIVGYDKDKELFYVTSSNLIANSDIDKVQTKIDHINSLDSIELKNYYKEIRKSGLKMHEKGAGLGFIEMAKRSSKKLVYSFEPYDKAYKFFVLKIYS